MSHAARRLGGPGQPQGMKRDTGIQAPYVQNFLEMLRMPLSQGPLGFAFNMCLTSQCFLPLAILHLAYGARGLVPLGFLANKASNSISRCVGLVFRVRVSYIKNPSAYSDKRPRTISRRASDGEMWVM